MAVYLYVQVIPPVVPRQNCSLTKWGAYTFVSRNRYMSKLAIDLEFVRQHLLSGVGIHYLASQYSPPAAHYW
jgi:hypothetical protein